MTSPERVNNARVNKYDCDPNSDCLVSQPGDKTLVLEGSRSKKSDREDSDRVDDREQKQQGCLVDVLWKDVKRLFLNAHDIIEHATNKAYPYWRHFSACERERERERV